MGQRPVSDPKKHIREPPQLAQAGIFHPLHEQRILVLRSSAVPLYRSAALRAASGRWPQGLVYIRLLYLSRINLGYTLQATHCRGGSRTARQKTCAMLGQFSPVSADRLRSPGRRPRRGPRLLAVGETHGKGTPHPAFGTPLPARAGRGEGGEGWRFRGRCPRLMMSRPCGAEAGEPVDPV